MLQIRYDIPGASSPYSTCLDISTVMTLSRSASSRAVRRERDVHRRAQGRERRRLRPLERQPGLAAIRPAAASPTRDDDLGQRGDHDPDLADRLVRALDAALQLRRIPRGLQRAFERGPSRRWQLRGPGHGRCLHVRSVPAVRRTPTGRRSTPMAAGSSLRPVPVGMASVVVLVVALACVPAATPLDVPSPTSTASSCCPVDRPIAKHRRPGCAA